MNKKSNNKIRFLALDLDGTLTNSKKQITERTKKTLWRAVEKGITIILASGRPTIGIQKVAWELELENKGGYILAYNGGQIIDCRTNKILYEQSISTEFYGTICNLARKFELLALTHDKGRVICEDDSGEYVKKEAFNNGLDILRVSCLEEHITDKVLKFMIVGDANRINDALPVIQEKFYGKLNVFLSEPYFIEIVPMRVEKAMSLNWLIQSLEGCRDNIMAVGDGLNDIPMLKYAGLSVAMENAYEETKAQAHFITDSNDNDGVAAAVERFILKEEAYAKGNPLYEMGNGEAHY